MAGFFFLGYSPPRPAGRASLARRAPRRVLGGQEDPGSPAHPVRPRPPRGRGSRARLGYLAARGWRGSGVLSSAPRWVCVGFRVTAGSTEDDGLGVRVPWGCSAAGCGALLAPKSCSLTCPFGPGSPDSPWGQRMKEIRWGSSTRLAVVFGVGGHMHSPPGMPPKGHSCPLPSRPSPPRGRERRGHPKAKTTKL